MGALYRVEGGLGIRESLILVKHFAEANMASRRAKLVWLGPASCDGFAGGGRNWGLKCVPKNMPDLLHPDSDITATRELQKMVVLCQKMESKTLAVRKV